MTLFRSLMVAVAMLGLAACSSSDSGVGQGIGGGGGGGGGGGTPPPGGDTGETIKFADVNCDVSASGPVAGPLDPVQGALIDEIGAQLVVLPQLGEPLVHVVTALGRLLDVVDALAASGETLFVERDPAAGGDALSGGALAVQCGAKSLAQAYMDSPLAAALPTSSQQLVEELAELTLVFSGEDSIGLAGLEDLTSRLAAIATRLSGMVSVVQNFPELLPAELGDAAGQIPAEALFPLLDAPAVLLANLAELLESAGGLHGQQTADAVAVTLTDLLGAVAAFDPSGSATGLLDEAQAHLSGGLGLILVPLFDAIQTGLGGSATGLFSSFLVDGIDGFPGAPNPLATYLGGNAPGGDSLTDLLAGVPLLGDLLGLVLASSGSGFAFADADAGKALLHDLLNGAGPEGAESLLAALTVAGTQLQALAPAGLGDGGAAFASDGEALQALLGLIEDNPAGALLDKLRTTLGGGSVPVYAAADLGAALEALFTEIADLSGGGLLGSLLGLIGDLINGVLALLGSNPLASLVSGMLGNFIAEQPGLELGELSDALDTLLGGFKAFAP